MPAAKHPQGGCGQYRLQQEPQRATILDVVVLDNPLFAAQHLLSALLYQRFEPHIPQRTDHRAVVTHQVLASAYRVLCMLREYGAERAAMPAIFQGHERAQDLVSLFLE